MIGSGSFQEDSAANWEELRRDSGTIETHVVALKLYSHPKSFHSPEHQHDN